MTGWTPNRVLYFGDHPYADLADLSLYLGKIFLRLKYKVNFLGVAKGQLISKCPYEKSVWTKIATKIFPRFLFLKFTTSRLLQNRVYLLANRT